MSLVGSDLISGGVDFNIIEQLKETILNMLKEAIDKNATFITNDMIKKQIEENMESLFKSYPVQLEASKMFNRELFPIYKRALDEFAKFNTIVKDAKGEIDKAIEEYKNAIIANPNDIEKINEAKRKLIEKLMSISDTKVGDVLKLKEGDEKEGDGLSMEGGGLKKFLENKDNEFTPIVGGTPAPEYMKGGTNKIDVGLKEIVGGMEEDYKKCNEGIKESNAANAKVDAERRKKPVLGNKQGGGKSKRRKHRKRSKTHKKRR